ncbi:HGxxPAAW family protein [Zhihengliuella salsuginis]|uniref:Uncharacterized protein n=1 Tax=Zhihengliuella salsuginis TaxID=578222 RepID=A0ABQ3GC98_9MICC|nr:HGxxPAAW family protein [Zhihengliuella salsuginis]GHD01416.1 hypothetical protein GCM10008096_05510 [Zhihengliuella salsuginis]
MANATTQTTQAIDPMHAEQPGHGNSVAAWSMVAVMLLGFAVGCVGFTIANMIVLSVGIVIILAGLILGWILKKAGFGVGGAKSKSSH